MIPYSTLPSPPDYLTSHGVAKWSEVGGRLVEMQELSEANIDVLRLYCEAWEDFRLAMEELQAHGSSTCVSEKGGHYAHPAVSRKSAAIKRLEKFGKQLGWSQVKDTGKKANKISSRPENL